MGSKLFIGSIGISSLASSVAIGTSYSNTEIDLDEVQYVEERCDSLSNPANLIGARHSFMVLSTYGGNKIRLDYDGEMNVISNYFDIFSPAETFRLAKASPKLSVYEAKRVFAKHSEEEPYNALSHNCQHVVRDSYNELTGNHDTMLRNDFLFALFKSVPNERKAMFVDEDSIRGEVLQDVYRPIRNAITNSPNLYEAMMKVRKAHQTPKLRLLFYRLYDLGLIDGPEPDDDEFNGLQRAMNEALEEAAEKYK